MLAVALHVAEAVGSDAGAGVNRDTVAEARAAVEGHGSHEVALFAQLDAGPHHAMRTDDGSAPDRRAVADDGIWADRDAAGQPDAGPDHGGGVDSLRRLRRAVESREERKQRFLRLGDDDACANRA